MSVTAISAVAGLPYKGDISIITAQGTGTINPGDFVSYSGHRVFATNSGHSAYWKISAAGVALESNPVYDPAGRAILNSGLKILVQGIIRVSGAQSGSGTLGLLAFPITTGSGVGGVTGLSGIGATWTAAAPVAISSNPTGQIASPVGKIIGVNMAGGQSAQLDVLLAPGINGYYG
jgi:hypothetical protein